MDLPAGVPLAGYGGDDRRGFPDLLGLRPYAKWFASSEGTRDPIRAKALWLERDGVRIAWLGLDLVGLPASLRARVLAAAPAALALDEDSLLMSATHTHSGPGALAPSLLWELVAVDRFEAEVEARVVDASVAALVAAEAGAQIAVAHRADFDAAPLQRNRRDRPGHFDPMGRLLLLQNAAGEWIGGIVHVAIHGTVLRPSNLLASADAAGALERAVAGALAGAGGPPPVLFLNGAEGDVAPSVSGDAGLLWIESEAGAEVAAALPGAVPVLDPVLAVASAPVALGSPELHLDRCADGFLGALLPGFLDLPLGLLLPDASRVWAVRIGPLLLRTWPGEPTTDLGLEVTALPAGGGVDETWVVALSQDHLSYFTTPDEFDEGGYEACGSFYGPEGGGLVVDAHDGLIP